MSVRQGLLALLAEGEAYGYQLRSDFEQRTGGTWPLNIGQVYTTLDRLERDHAALFRTHSLVLVRLERFRLAFQMVASELARKSPGNIALVHARALLDDAFVVEADLPDELRDLLHAIDARAAAGAQAA